MRILLALNEQLARTVAPAITIEAEYGTNVVIGSRFTSAHHQKDGQYSSKNSPAPCNNEALGDFALGKDDIVLLSHFDLDSLGGVLRTMPQARRLFDEEYKSFWDLVEFVDLNGLYMLGRYAALREVDRKRLWAFLAWNRTNPIDASTDQLALINDHVAEAMLALMSILEGDDQFLKAGTTFEAERIRIFDRTLFVEEDGVVARLSREPVELMSDLYLPNSPAMVMWEGPTAPMAIGTITLSLAHEIDGIDCREIAQSIWGPAVLGGRNCASSPYNERIKLGDFYTAFMQFKSLLKSERFRRYYGGK